VNNGGGKGGQTKKNEKGKGEGEQGTKIRGLEVGEASP